MCMEKVDFATIERVLNLRPITHSEFRQGKLKRSKTTGANSSNSSSGISRWDRKVSQANIFTYVATTIFLKTFLSREVLINLFMAPPYGISYSYWRCLVGDCRPAKRSQSLDMQIISQLRKLAGSEPIITVAELRSLANDLRSHYSKGEDEFWSPSFLIPAAYLPKYLKDEITSQLRYQDHQVDKLFICPVHFQFPNDQPEKLPYHDFRLVRPYLSVQNLLFMTRCSFFGVKLSLKQPKTSARQDLSTRVLQFLRTGADKLSPHTYNPYFVKMPEFSLDLYKPAIENLFQSDSLLDIRVDIESHRIGVWCPLTGIEFKKPLCVLRNHASIPLPSLCADDYISAFQFFSKKFKTLARNIQNLTSMVEDCFSGVDPSSARACLTEGYLLFYSLVTTFLFCLILVFYLSYVTMDILSCPVLTFLLSFLCLFLFVQYVIFFNFLRLKSNPVINFERDDTDEEGLSVSLRGFLHSVHSKFMSL